MAAKLIKAAVIIFAAVCAYWLAVILHEAGHLCMGLLTGSSFVSFRIGSFLIYKDHNRLKVRRMNIPGTLGQCVMMPKEAEDPEIRDGVLYHGGGGLFNLLTALICLCVFLSVSNVYIRVFTVILAAVSLFLALLNLAPAKISLPNDGYNIRLLIHNKADRKAIHQILRIQGYTSSTPSEIPLKEFEFSEEGEYAQVMKLMKASYYEDAGDLEEAEKLFRDCAAKDSKNMDYYRLEAEKELLYCLLIRKAEDNEIQELMDEELKAYLENTKNISISRSRAMYTYYHLFTHEEEKAEAEYQEAMRLIAEQPDSGEARMEQKLLAAAKNAGAL